MRGGDWARHYAAVGQAGGGDSAKPLGELRLALKQKQQEQQQLLFKGGQEEVEADGGHRSLIFGTVVNITKTIVGAGILCLPHSLHEGGTGLGFFSLFATGLLSLAGFLAIGHVCHSTGAETYREAWVRTVGASPAWVDVVIGFECAICCVGYVILILDYVSIGLQGLLGLEASGSLRVAVAMAATLAFIPLCLQTDFHSLRFSSLFGNVVTLYTLLYVVFECAAWEDHWEFLHDASFLGSDRDGIFRSTCVMTSAYIAHYSAPSFYTELARGTKDPQRAWCGFFAASVLSFAAVMVTYAVFGLAGFARFGPSIVGNVLLNYDSGVCILLAWVSMAAALTVSFPLQFKPVRDTLATVLRLTPDDSSSGGSSGTASGQSASVSPWTLMTSLTVVSLTGVGILVTDISRVLAFRGALLGCPISFVMPGLMLLKGPGMAPCGRPFQQIGAWTLIAFGVAAGMLGFHCALQG